eukprot:9432335-Ditylum_brightwellii.AAC.1
MGWKHISVLFDKIPIKERVEDQDQIVSEIESSQTDDVEWKNIVSGENKKSYREALINNGT